jgi:SAM-dependent methyltransferase
MLRLQADLLEAALPLIRLPDSPDVAPTLLESHSGYANPSSGAAHPLVGGVLDLLASDFEPTDAQKILDRGWSAALYDWARPRLPRILGMPSFASEVDAVVERLELREGATVLDVACGHGNFTAALAERVGREGLVIGVDISRAMLSRAAANLRARRLDNVLLIRADALDLPLAGGAFAKVNCSGGLHQFPDLTRAIREMSRVSGPGARIAVSGFAEAADDPARRFKRWTTRRFEAHFVPMDRLAHELEAANYHEIAGEMHGRWVGYRWGAKPTT